VSTFTNVNEIKFILFARVDAHAFDIALIAIGRCKYRRGYEISAHDAHIDSPSSSTLIVKRLKPNYFKVMGENPKSLKNN
jgi:hypothetical protein